MYQNKLQNAEFTDAGHTAQVNSCGSNHLKVLKVLKSAKVGPIQKFKIVVHLHFYAGGVKHSHKKRNPWDGSLSRNDQMQQMLTLLTSKKSNTAKCQVQSGYMLVARCSALGFPKLPPA